MQSCCREKSTLKEVMNELNNNQEENETPNPVAWQDLTLQTAMCAVCTHKGNMHTYYCVSCLQSPVSP